MTNKVFVPSFGIEIHCELKTNTKAFSPSLNSFGQKPNTTINQIDLGYPGSKPLVNKKMVEFAYRLAKALDMQIAENLYFDRKNYFYPDLAKGYQLTQFYHPIGKNGKLKIWNKDNSTFEVVITDIHMEEDTAKMIRLPDGSKGYDFNRAGSPLIEIVSDHKQLHTIEDVTNYIEQMRQLLVMLDITDGKMENGSFRVDVNVSVREKDSKEFGKRVEIKNINSLNFVKKALEFEIEKQIETLQSGHSVESTTKRFDEESGTTVVMRTKTTVNEYNYFAEANINPIKLTEPLVKSFDLKTDSYSYLLREKLSTKMSKEQIDTLFTNDEMFKLFFEMTKSNNDYLGIFNFIFSFLTSYLKERNLDLKSIKPDHKTFQDIIDLLGNNRITKAQAIEILDSNDFEQRIENAKSIKLMSETEIRELINKIIYDNPNLAQERQERKFKFVMGEIMKVAKGKINSKQASELLMEIINQ